MKIEEIEKELDKLKPLKFNNKKALPKSYEECIDRVIQGEATFMNSDIYPQCHSSKMRGIADIYRTCKHYFPNVKLKNIVQHARKKPHQFCCTTNQTVFSRANGYSDKMGILIRTGHSSKAPIKYIEN